VIGNCHGEDTEMFYDAREWARAAAICKGCPVLAACRLDFAGDPFAYAGGMTPHQRAQWNRQRIATAKARPKPRKGGFKPRISEEQKEMVLARWDAELIGPAGIAKEFGMAKSTVQTILRKAGRVRTPEELRELSLRGSRTRVDGEVTRAMVLKLYAENYEPAEIAKLVGVSLGHVYSIHTGTPERKRREKQDELRSQQQ
jgi:hypothetical protein